MLDFFTNLLRLESLPAGVQQRPPETEFRLPDGVRRLCWSPVADTWDEAQVMAACAGWGRHEY